MMIIIQMVTAYFWSALIFFVIYFMKTFQENQRVTNDSSVRSPFCDLNSIRIRSFDAFEVELNAFRGETGKLQWLVSGEAYSIRSE